MLTDVAGQNRGPAGADSPDRGEAKGAALGGDDIYVPDGVDVEMTGFALLGGKDEHGATTPVPRGCGSGHSR